MLGDPDSGIQENIACGIRTPNNYWNPESKFTWPRLESMIQYLESETLRREIKDLRLSSIPLHHTLGEFCAKKLRSLLPHIEIALRQPAQSFNGFRSKKTPSWEASTQWKMIPYWAAHTCTYPVRPNQGVLPLGDLLKANGIIWWRMSDLTNDFT